jgi:hypothetical protein
MVSTMMFHPAFLLAFTLLPSANARLFTVVNLCSFTIWHVFAPCLVYF